MEKLLKKVTEAHKKWDEQNDAKIFEDFCVAVVEHVAATTKNPQTTSAAIKALTKSLESSYGIQKPEL